MISTWKLLIVIGCYLFSVYVTYRVFESRMKAMETEYRLNFARVCATFIDAMQTISKAIDTEPEQTTLHEWAVTMCRSSGCHYFDGFGCTRSDVVTDRDEKCPCDIDMRRATDE